MALGQALKALEKMATMRWFGSIILRLADKGYTIHKQDTKGKAWIGIDFLHGLQTAKTEIYPAIRNAAA